MKVLLARPTGFEPVTLGLEMREIGYTNDIVLLFYNIYFTTCLRKWLKNSLLYTSKLDNEEDKFLYQFCLWFRGAWLMVPGNGTLLPKFILT